MKRLITFIRTVDNKGIIKTISEPIDLDSINFVLDDSMKENSAFIDADIPKPINIPNKRTVLLYNLETKGIEVHYEDIHFEEMTPTEKIEFLYSENEKLCTENSNLKEELNLTQLALFDLDNKLNGTGEGDSNG